MRLRVTVKVSFWTINFVYAIWDLRVINVNQKHL